MSDRPWRIFGGIMRADALTVIPKNLDRAAITGVARIVRIGHAGL